MTMTDPSVTEQITCVIHLLHSLFLGTSLYTQYNIVSNILYYLLIIVF